MQTSNLGSQHLLAAAARPGDVDAVPAAHEAVLDEARRHFRPEFLNRIDDIVVFDALTQHMLREIAVKAAKEIGARLAHKSISLEWDPAALDLAVQRSFDAAYGARPLRRWLERVVVTDLSRRLIAGELADGCKVVVGAEDGAMMYKITRRPEGEPGGKVKPSKMNKLGSIGSGDLVSPSEDSGGDDSGDEYY